MDFTVYKSVYVQEIDHVMWCVFLIEGCIYPTRAPMHNVCGLPETVRLCPKHFVIWVSLSACVTIIGTYLQFV